MVRAIRGATVIVENEKQSIVEGTKELLEKLIKKNSLNADDIISIIFSATNDLTQEFPAVAARKMGLTNVPLLCCKELEIEGSLPKCVRILMHVNKTEEVSHVYLGNAKQLRDDIN